MAAYCAFDALQVLAVALGVIVGLLLSTHGSATLTERNWAWTLERLRQLFDVESLTKAATFSPADVERYYRLTTFRDYGILAAATRCSAMHTELKPAAAQPFRIGHFKQLVYALLHLDGSIPKPAILEVGFGKGVNSVALASLLPHASCMGIDIVEEHATFARKLAADAGATNVEFTCGNAADPPPNVRSRRFDLIFGIESFCHLDTDELMDGFMAFAESALGDNGKLVIVDGFRSGRFHDTSPDARMAMQLAECGFKVRRMASKAMWCTLAKAHGFELVHDEDLTQQAIPFWTMGWRVASVILHFPSTLRLFIHSNAARVETGGNLLAVCCTAFAFHMGSAQYGVLTFRKHQM